MKERVYYVALLLDSTRSAAFVTTSAVQRTVLSRLSMAASECGGAPVLPKVFESALAIIPPGEAWPPLQRARTEQRDAGLIRWPPHANLLYPFVPLQHFDKLGPALAKALQDLPPFTITLAKFASFDRAESSV